MFVVERLIDVFAPHDCMVCGREGKLVCDWCFFDMCPPVPNRCYRCLAASPESATCKRCRSKTPLKHVWVRTDYQGAAKELVRVFKFERKQAAAPIMARYLHEALPYLKDRLIVAAPTATSRYRQRGYDQAKLLAKSLA